MGADFEAKESRGLTPLHLAIKGFESGDSTRNIKALLLKGADRNSSDNQGRKPIDYIPLDSL